jgi:hypothetical protein
MRNLLLVCVSLAAGCAAQGLPIEGGANGGAGSGGNQSVPDMTKPLGGMGASCQTACDCTPGLSCTQGTCGTSRFGQLYCCESSTCPAGSFCQSSMGGFGQCSQSGGNGGGNGGGGGGFPGLPDFGIPGGFGDGGAGQFCTFIRCQSNAQCTNFGCGSCGAGGTCKQ